jgi:hypothetical protein
MGGMPCAETVELEIETLGRIIANNRIAAVNDIIAVFKNFLFIFLSPYLSYLLTYVIR